MLRKRRKVFNESKGRKLYTYSTYKRHIAVIRYKGTGLPSEAAQKKPIQFIE